MTRMSNQEYWIERAKQRLISSEQKALRLENNLKKQFKKTYKNIENEISKFYFRYVNENGMEYDEAIKYLNSDELKVYKNNVSEYIKIAQNNNFSEEYIKKLKGISVKARVKRLESLKQSIEFEAHELYEKYLSPNLQITLYDILVENYYKTVFDIQQFIGYGVSFNKISPNTLNSLLVYPWSGKNYSEKIWGNANSFTSKLDNVLTQGIIQGKSNQSIAKQLQTATNTSYKNAVRLVRTETNFIANQATIKAYNNCDVKQYQYIATLDLRTSEACVALDGKVFDTDEAIVGVNYPPMHPHCRSTTIPYFEDLDEDGGTRIARSSDGKQYKVPGDMTYNEWRNKYIEVPEAEMRSINKYISSESYRINEKLRDGIKLTDDDKELIKHLDKVLTKLPKYKGTVTRSLYFNYEEDLNNFLKIHNIGDTIKYKAYTSTTIGEIYNPNGQIQMIINSKKGRDFTKYNPGEKEILFKRNTRFTITDIVDDNGQKIIYMREE